MDRISSFIIFHHYKYNMEEILKTMLLLSKFKLHVPKEIINKISLEYIQEQLGLDGAIKLSAALGRLDWIKHYQELNGNISDGVLACTVERNDIKLFKYMLKFSPTIDMTKEVILVEDGVEFYKILYDEDKIEDMYDLDIATDNSSVKIIDFILSVLDTDYKEIMAILDNVKDGKVLDVYIKHIIFEYQDYERIKHKLSKTQRKKVNIIES